MEGKTTSLQSPHSLPPASWPRSDAGDVAVAGLAAVHDDLHLCLLRGPVACRQPRGQGSLGARGQGLGQRAGRGLALDPWGPGPLQRRVARLARVEVIRVVLVRHSTHLQRAQEPLEQEAVWIRNIVVAAGMTCVELCYCVC